MNNMTEKDESQLFLVRLWLDGESEAGNEESGAALTWDSSCHGKVQHVLSGKASAFNNWQTLVEHLFEMMPSQGSSQIINPLNRKE